MKNLYIILSVLFLNINIFPFEKSDKPPKHEFCCKNTPKKADFIEQKIKILKEDGIISLQEEKDVLDAIEELKNYKKQIWEDDKLTKEEKEILRKKEKNLREKVRNIMQKAEEHFNNDSLQDKEKRFNSKIDALLNSGKIRETDAKSLKEAHSKLIKIEQSIWEDGVMTKDEHKKLIEEKEKFRKLNFSILGKPEKKQKNKFKEDRPFECPPCEKGQHPKCPKHPEPPLPEGGFIPPFLEQMPPFLEKNHIPYNYMRFSEDI